MQEAGGDWDLWKWALGVIGSILGGAAVGGWVSRGMLESIKQRMATIERDQSKCQVTLKDDIRTIVQGAIDQQAMRNSEHLQAIRTELAVLVALHGETQKDVQALFDRVDRRQTERVLTPHGERREK